MTIETASADHIPGVEALIEGLSLRKQSPGYFIHVAGTGMLSDVSNGFGLFPSPPPENSQAPITKSNFSQQGQPSSKIYNDTLDLATITSFPIENHVHRDVDIAILNANKKFGVPTAIVSPPTIHGVGRGPIKTRSLQIPFLVEAVLKRGRGFQVLEGQNIWDRKFGSSKLGYIAEDKIADLRCRCSY